MKKKLWLGIPELEYIWRGNYEDSLICYHGTCLTEWDITDMMYEYGKEQGLDMENDDVFVQFCKDNADSIYGYFDDVAFFKNEEEQRISNNMRGENMRSGKHLMNNKRVGNRKTLLKSSNVSQLDYEDEIYNDLYDFVEQQYQEGNPIDYDTIYDLAWTSDSVTGNSSGSYFFSRAKAMDAILNRYDGMELLIEALSEFEVSDAEVGDKFLSEDWEYFDVTIRCYLLGQVLQKVLDDYESNNNLSNSRRIRKNLR